MYKSRLLLSVISLTGALASGLTACGDDSDGNNVAPDASTSDDAGGGVDASPPPTNDSGVPNAVASAVTAYLGHAVALDGSGSTGPAGFTYAWTVAGVPDGSVITTASLVGANTATPSFVPDRPGTYTVKLTITAGTATSSADAVVTIVDPPIFYVHTENDASAGYQASMNVVGAGVGNGGAAVSCLRTDAGSYDDAGANYVAQAGADWWEAPAGQPSKAVFLYQSTMEDGGLQTVLATTTSAASCATPPSTIDSYPSGDVTFPIQHPRLSPSGSRVTYIRTAVGMAGARIATVGFDGSAKREVAPWGATPDGTPNPDAGAPIPTTSRPVWMNETTVAWIQRLQDGWRVVSAPDQENATITVVMTCTGTQPSQLDFLANGEVIVSQTGHPADGGTATDIVAYPIDPATKECGAPRSIAKLEVGGASASDFSLSPDKTRVAYLGRTGLQGTDDVEIFVAPVDGSTTPVSIASPLVGAYRGPRWVGGGAFITWGIAATQLDAGTGNAVAVVRTDGGVARSAASGPAGTNTYSIGNGLFSSCSYGPAFGSGATLVGLASLFVLRALRRRRR